MRIAFAGTPDESAVALRAVHAADHEIVLVVTRPDRPKGRGRALVAPPVKEVALDYGLPLFQPENVNDAAAVETIRAARPEVFVVVAFGAILREPLLTLAPRGALNVHFSLLPAYRGACPVEWAIIEGRHETGVTTMFMAAEVDAGDVILMRRLAIGENETAGELRRRLAVLGAGLLVETLEHVARGPVPRAVQDASLRSKAPRLRDEMAVIDWTRDAVTLHNLIRALNPDPGAVAALGGDTIKVWRTRVHGAGGAGGAEAAVPVHPGVTPGTILAVEREGPVVACGRGSLVLTELQAPGKRALGGGDFARGRRLAPGQSFGRAVPPAPGEAG